jgi:hypothetical protein
VRKISDALVVDSQVHGRLQSLVEIVGLIFGEFFRLHIGLAEGQERVDQLRARLVIVVANSQLALDVEAPGVNFSLRLKVIEGKLLVKTKVWSEPQAT